MKKQSLDRRGVVIVGVLDLDLKTCERDLKRAVMEVGNG